MKRITFEVEFVTPCFLGGADNVNTAEWRAASIRGQLRWWFRAVAGGNFDGELKLVAAAEERLFGSTARASGVRVRVVGALPTSVGAGRRCEWGVGRSALDIASAWCEPDSAHRLRLGREPELRSNPVHYTAYGPVAPNGSVRGRIEAGSKACFALQLSRGIDLGDRQLLTKAIWAWLHLGGIGARSRRGWGSLFCTKVEGGDCAGLPCPCPDLKSFKEAVGCRFAKVDYRQSNGLPEWSHFSSRSAVYLGTIGQDSWDDAMDLVGSWLIGFRRRYGHPGDTRILAETALAERDYAWAAHRSDTRPTEAPDRVGFGLPLPFGGDGETISWLDVGGLSRGQAVPGHRRGSPLLIHIAKFTVNRDLYFPIFTHLPARLIPDQHNLIYRRRPDVPFAVNSRHEEVVRDFLTDLATKRLVERVS